MDPSPVPSAICPYPFFPALTDVWTDGGNWRLGHWLTGRLGAVSLAALVRHLYLRALLPEDRNQVSTWRRMAREGKLVLPARKLRSKKVAAEAAGSVQGVLMFLVLEFLPDRNMALRQGEPSPFGRLNKPDVGL